MDVLHRYEDGFLVCLALRIKTTLNRENFESLALVRYYAWLYSDARNRTGYLFQALRLVPMERSVDLVLSLLNDLFMKLGENYQSDAVAYLCETQNRGMMTAAESLLLVCDFFRFPAMSFSRFTIFSERNRV